MNEVDDCESKMDDFENENEWETWVI